GVVAESVVAWELADALVEQFGKDRMELLKQNIMQHNNYAKEF
ncbi:chorismate synthase, partial [Bacillus thuringiensis]|nr:chorismate synthase [Bacillus thuringiensis]